MKKDITGQRFGRLIAISPNGTQGKNTKWYCQCDCGNFKTVNISSLTRGLCKSCGCLRKENTAFMFKKHGYRDTKLYSVFCTMKSRCYNPNSKQYKYYGEKGVSICDEWLADFKSFYDWSIKNGYEEGMTIDRIDVNGNYEPTNCRWVGFPSQANNKTNNIMITHNDETHTLAEWATIKGISYTALYQRIMVHNWSVDKALNTRWA